MAEAYRPGTFAAVYAFEPVLWPVSPAARYQYSPALLLVASPGFGCLKQATETLTLQRALSKAFGCHVHNGKFRLSLCCYALHVQEVLQMVCRRTKWSNINLKLSRCSQLEHMLIGSVHFEHISSIFEGTGTGSTVEDSPCRKQVIMQCSGSQQVILGYQALARMAKHRRSRFDSKDDASNSFKSKLPFAAFHPDCLQNYIGSGLIQNSGK